MAHVLQVSPAGYYAWRKRTTPSQRIIADEILMARIRTVFKESHKRYGSPRVQRELRDEVTALGRSELRVSCETAASRRGGGGEGSKPPTPHTATGSHQISWLGSSM